MNWEDKKNTINYFAEKLEEEINNFIIEEIDSTIFIKNTININQIHYENLITIYKNNYTEFGRTMLKKYYNSKIEPLYNGVHFIDYDYNDEKNNKKNNLIDELISLGRNPELNFKYITQFVEIYIEITIRKPPTMVKSARK